MVAYAILNLCMRWGSRMSKYLIKLKPMDAFYFGDEISFEKNGANKEKNYLVRSRKFPQQTSILGMLRKEVLINTEHYKETWKDYIEHYKTNHYEIDRLIGKSGFQFDANDVQDFGEIQSISPVFLMKNDSCYIEIPKDFDLNAQEKGETNEYPHLKVEITDDNKGR